MSLQINSKSGFNFSFPTLFLVVACLLFPVKAFAETDAGRIITLNGHPGQRIGKYVEVLIDKGKQLSIQSVAGPLYDNQFKPSDVDVPNLGIVKAAVWTRFTVHNPLDMPQPRYLSFDFPTASHVILFIPHESGFERIDAGHAVKATEKLIPNRHYVFPVTIGAKETKTFYLRVLSESNTALPMTLWVPTALDRQNHRDQMTFGIIYGILIAFIVYFTALALNLKNPAVVWFTLYIACLGLLLSCYQGYLQALLRPVFADLIRVVLISAIGLLYFTGAKFFRIFLNTPFYSRPIDRTLQVLQWMGLGFIPMNLFDNPLTPLYGLVLVGIGPLFSTAVSVVFWIKGVPNAKYLAIGWIIGHTASEIDLLRVMAVIPWTAGSIYLIPAGMISTIVFFSIAILEQTRMYREYANKDGLTGIANRRYFDETLTTEWNRHLRNQHPLSVLIVDIDNFKAFNDSYGHFQGDACLKAGGEIMNKTMRRAGDLAARYGGDEFIALLPETNASQALHVGESIHKAVEGLSIPHRASSTADVITVSIGTGTMVPDKGTAPSDLINQADKSLYMAKNSGRNRVVSD